MSEPRLVRATTGGGRSIVVPVLDLDAADRRDGPAATGPAGGLGGGEFGGGREGEGQVSGKLVNLRDALDAVEDLADGIRAMASSARPTKASVEFSISFALVAGRLTAMFVDGRTEGSIKITMEWESKDVKDADADGAGRD